MVTDCRAYYRITPKKQRGGSQRERSRGEVTLRRALESASEWSKQIHCTELSDIRLMEKYLCYAATSPEDIRKGWLSPSPTLLHHFLRIWWVTGCDVLKRSHYIPDFFLTSDCASCMCVSVTHPGWRSLLTVDFNFPSAKQVDEASSAEVIIAWLNILFVLTHCSLLTPHAETYVRQ